MKERKRGRDYVKSKQKYLAWLSNNLISLSLCGSFSLSLLTFSLYDDYLVSEEKCIEKDKSWSQRKEGTHLAIWSPLSLLVRSPSKPFAAKTTQQRTIWHDTLPFSLIISPPTSYLLILTLRVLLAKQPVLSSLSPGHEGTRWSLVCPSTTAPFSQL